MFNLLAIAAADCTSHLHHPACTGSIRVRFRICCWGYWYYWGSWGMFYMFDLSYLGRVGRVHVAKQVLVN
jgi:hypothetical protein